MNMSISNMLNTFIPSDMQSAASSLFSTYATLTASMMLLRSATNDFIPSPVRSYVVTKIRDWFFTRRTESIHFITIVVEEYSGYMSNQIFQSAEIYLRTKINPDTERFKVSKIPRQKTISVDIEKNQKIVDEFRDIELTWNYVPVEPKEGRSGKEKDLFELTFERKYKETVLNEYLPFVLDKAKEMKEDDRILRLYTRGYSYGNVDDDNDDGGYRPGWGSIKLEHPFTFDTLAMDPDMKTMIIDDLERFLRRRDYYKRVGKAWKRGYLLYGPPGTGKSSLVAAIANYIRFDIYDLELTSIYSNADLRNILLSTSNRSIIVIEDIDCASQTKNRQQTDSYDEKESSGLTLSGILNFIDGLWSSCGDERIIVFTTNHKDRMDPALLRPGRMDMHIHMSYCTYNGFKTLASNYLGVSDHMVFAEIEELIGDAMVSPAQIAEEMMRSEDVDIALDGVITLIKKKKEEKELGSNVDNENLMIEANDSDGRKRKTIAGVNQTGKRVKRETKSITHKRGRGRWRGR